MAHGNRCPKKIRSRIIQENGSSMTPAKNLTPVAGSVVMTGSLAFGVCVAIVVAALK